MTQLLRQNTTTTIKMGPFLDSSDGVTEETGLTLNYVQLSKNGGTFASRSSTTAASHDADGYYNVELNSTDTGTLGRVIVKAHASGTHLPVRHEFTVVPVNVYDSLVANSDNLEVDAVLISASSVAADNVEANIGNLDAAITTRSTLSQSDILSDATPFAGANIDVQISSRSNHAAGDVWVVGVTEPTAAFSWGGSYGDLVKFLGALSRNKITQSSNSQTLRNDADDANLATASISDNGSTFTRGEWG